MVVHWNKNEHLYNIYYYNTAPFYILTPLVLMNS